MKKNPAPTLPLLPTLDKDALIQLVEALQQKNLILEEEKRMQASFAHISETNGNDAALMWRGRNRFLAEKVRPVTTKELPEKSFPQHTGGDHRIYDGDNLAVMRSLLSEYRGGQKRALTWCTSTRPTTRARTPLCTTTTTASRRPKCKR